MPVVLAEMGTVGHNLPIPGAPGLYYTILAGSLGYLLHLMADSFTHHGVPWLWPIYRHSFGVPLVRFDTGSTLEYLAVVAVVVFTTLVVQGSGFILF